MVDPTTKRLPPLIGLFESFLFVEALTPESFIFLPTVESVLVGRFATLDVAFFIPLVKPFKN